jgi:hypothetical protein
MSVTDRQRRRQQLQGNTQFGQQVVAPRQGAPLRDVPSGDQTVYPERDASGALKTPLGDQPGADVPIPEGFEQAYNAAQNIAPPLPVIKSAATAYALASRLKAQGRAVLGEEAFGRGVNALRLFQQTYPGALEAYRGEVQRTQWMAENLDTTPQKSSRLTAAQRSAAAQRARAEGREPTFASQAAARDIPYPKTLKDLPPLEDGSRAQVLEREEALGLDTQSGITSFGEEFNLARKVNGSDSQMRMMYSLAKDNLERQGITLPEGLDPINYNEDLGQLEALVPTEDGKVRRVLVDPEFFRPQDFGSVADIEEAMAIAGATVSQLPGAGTGMRTLNKLAQRHPALAEFVGDFGWRNTGIVLEGLLDAEALGGGTTLDDVVKALDKTDNLGESATGTAFSRVLGRLVGGSGKAKQDIEVNLNQYKRAGDTAEQTAERANKEIQDNLEESAETLTRVQELTEVPFTTTKAEASGSLEAVAVQGGREARLNPKEQTQVEVRRDRNREALRDATDNIHNNRLPTNPSDTPEITSAKLSDEIVAKGQQAEDISVSISSFRDNDGAIDLYKWQYESGTGRVNLRGLGKPTTEAQRGRPNDLSDATSGADVRVDHARKEVTIQYVAEDEAFPGGAAILMERMLRDLDDIPADYRWVSDNQLSQYSMAMIDQLEKAGFGVRMFPGTSVAKDGDITWTYGPGREPVYEITHIPGRMMRVPMAADTAEYSASRMADTLNDDLAFLEKAGADADFWGVKWKSVIGWQEARQKSIYHVKNPRTSKLNQFAQRLEARVERSLTGMDANAADATLGQVFRKQVDEDGYPILEGLTEETLDIGHLGRARDSLRSLHQRTGDAEVGALVDAIDDLFTDGGIVDNFGNPLEVGAEVAMRNTWKRLNETTDSMRRAESAIVSNPLFKQNADGEYINVDIKTMGNLLSNGSKFMQHIKPWMHGNPQGNQMVQEALMSVYKDKVLGGTGFTAAKHHTFLRNHKVALQEVFGPRELDEFSGTHFTAEGKNVLLERAEKSKSILNRLAQFGPLRAGNIIDDLTKIGKTGNPRARTKMYVRELDRMNPGLAAQVRADSLEEARRMINDRFFSQTANTNPAKAAGEFKNWIDGNADALRALHGDQYVTDLQSVWRGLHLDTQRFRIGSQVPSLQDDVVRTSRTLMGPLNVWQRRISASNWIRLRFHAKKAVEAISDPEKLRHLNSAKGIPMRSRPGIAAFVRSGILPGTGWDGAGEMPQEAYEKGLEFLDWLESVDEELQGEKVE